MDGALTDDTQELPVPRRAVEPAGRYLWAEAQADRDQNRRALEEVLAWAHVVLDEDSRAEVARIIKQHAARRRPE